MGISFNLGWECTLNNNGAVMSIPIKTDMNLLGIQVHCAMAFQPNVIGRAMALCYGVHLTAAEWANWQGPGAADYIRINQCPDVGAVGFDFRAGATGAGSGGLSDMLFSFILKSLAPAATDHGMYVPLHDMPVVAGDGLFFHMDHGENGPCDVEMQGVVFYR